MAAEFPCHRAARSLYSLQHVVHDDPRLGCLHVVLELCAGVHWPDVGVTEVSTLCFGGSVTEYVPAYGSMLRGVPGLRSSMGIQWTCGLIIDKAVAGRKEPSRR
jgi:hypothetical protein